MGFKNTDQTLLKVKENEAIFVLRGQDVTSPVIIMEWIKQNLPYCSDEKLRQAFECALSMRSYAPRKRAD